MTTFNYDCDSSVTYCAFPVYNAAIVQGYDIYQFNEKLPSLTYITYITGFTIYDFANPTEHLQFDCTPILDLDEQDISGSTGLNFKAPKTCMNPGQPVFPFAEASPAILTNTIVDSIWVGIAAGQSNGSNETLGCIETGNVTCDSKNGGIMFYNTAQMTNPQFMEALKQAVFYRNDADNMEEGIRTFAVVAYNNNYAGDTAFLELPLLAGTAATGIVTNPGSATANDGSIEISVTGSSSYEYLWSNGQTTQNIFDLPAGTYTVTITAQNGCSVELDFRLDFTNGAGYETPNLFEVVILPNPSGNTGAILQLNHAREVFSWRVFDTNGKIRAQGKSQGSTTTLPMHLPAGIYYMEVYDGWKAAHLRWVVGTE